MMPRSLLVAREASDVLERGNGKDVPVEMPNLGKAAAEEEDLEVDVVSEAEEKPLDFSVATPTQTPLGVVGAGQPIFYGKFMS